MSTSLVDHIKTIKPKRYALPLLSSAGLLFFEKFQNYIYTPPIVFFVSFILFWNIPIIVTYTNSKPLYFEDLFIDMSQLPSINIPKNGRDAFENYYKLLSMIVFSKLDTLSIFEHLIRLLSGSY